MKQSGVYYYLILDVSYSMELIWDIVKSQINLHLGNIADFQKEHSEILVKYRLITFNQEVQIFPIEDKTGKISTIIDKIVPDGQSALFDALGAVLKTIEKDVGAKKLKNCNFALILLLLTDGGDNVSKEFQYDSVTTNLQAIKNSSFSNVHFNLIGMDPSFNDLFNLLHIRGFHDEKIDQEELRNAFQYIESLLKCLRQRK